MIELNRHVAQRAQYKQAGQEARKDSFNYAMYQTMDERLSTMRSKQMRPKKRIPWFTIITVVTTIPFFFMGGGGVPTPPKAISPEQIHKPNQVGAGVEKNGVKKVSLAELQANNGK